MNNDEGNEPISISDRVEILSTEDQKIKAIGEILSSDSSREILKILFNETMSANQISQKTKISLPLVIYHLKKMQDSGVVKIANVEKNTKSRDMKFYTVDKLAIIILPSKMSEPAKNSKSLFNSFTRIHRLATLGGLSLAAWFSSQIIQKWVNTENGVEQSEPMMNSIPSETPEMALKAMPADEAATTISSAMPQVSTPDPSIQLLWSVVTVLCVIIAGLVIEVIISKKHNARLKIK